ncbi:MAG: hypothetical protein A2731_03510 [Candidatus Buchananbacteria bacterium RIFCSPHIGHO2_01_FULL_39_8]|uniref:acylphosphatase n=1 Tax=Candidatus Buchananbacteria bacterium RIFCSPHIGHO2_01_FULL_39_8 TaxID=1797533 RepID=A0A1G1XSR4_9BACT|nr:MAG: hypothetical protein A2731_03510 [Candidatus Buchananbacteria bacterium RIFCSPHIGHO2_01_FULL_39_8]
MIKRVTLKISGLVQGVGYRYLAQREAKKRGFVGYIKNLADGSVELVAEGEEKNLKDFIQWCYNGVGPAQVQKIEENWSEATGNFDDFVIR